MKLGKVIGSIWATRKAQGTDGLKILLVQPVTGEGKPFGKTLSAFDAIGCGEGELVYFVEQYEATLAFPDRPLTPIDVSIIGIVDTLEDQSAEVLASADRGEAGA